MNKNLVGRETLFKTLFGSKLYGTNTPLSDEDWKEVFLPPIQHLLIGKKPKNIVVSTGANHERNNKDDVDYEYIPIQVFANDFIGGQTYAVELAFSVLSNKQTASQELFDPLFKEFVKELTEKFLTSNIKAMIGYAMNQAQIYGIKGTRLASVRKFVEMLELGLYKNEFAETDRLEVVIDWVREHADKYVYLSTYENMDVDRPAISVLEKLYPTTITVWEALERTRNQKAKYGSRAHDSESAEGMDWKATAHAIRITKQAIRMLRDHEMQFPFDDEEVKFLLSIKNGERPFSEVEVLFVDLLAELDVMKENTTLPEKTPELMEEFELWLTNWMLKFYDVRQN